MRRYLFNLLPVALAMLSSPATAQQPCLQQAFEAYNAGHYAAAITASDECIVQLGAQATQDEEQLARMRTKRPSTQPSDSDKKIIFARGALNDAGAAYFIKGESARKLAGARGGRRYTTVARTAFDQCAALTYAMTFDPKGWFWFTSDACTQRRNLLPAPAAPVRKKK